MFLASVSTQQQAPLLHPHPKPPFLPVPHQANLASHPTSKNEAEVISVLHLPSLTIKLVCICLDLSCFPGQEGRRDLYLFDIVKAAVSFSLDHLSNNLVPPVALAFVPQLRSQHPQGFL